MVVIWSQSWVLEVFRFEIFYGVTFIFQEVIELVVKVVDRQIVFLDIWRFTKERGQRKERVRLELAEAEGSCFVLVDEQLGGETFMKGSLVRLIQGFEIFRRLEVIIEVVVEVKRKQLEFLYVAVMDIFSIIERIFIFGQVGVSSYGCQLWFLVGLSVRYFWLIVCSFLFYVCLFGQ